MIKENKTKKFDIENFNDIADVAKRWQQYRPDYYILPEYFNI